MSAFSIVGLYNIKHKRSTYCTCITLSGILSIKILPKNQKNLNHAYETINKIETLFNYKSKSKKKQLTDSEIKRRRNESEYLSFINDLNTYINDVHIDISNNLAERVVKSVAIARKFIFCKNINGTKTT